MNLQPSIFKQLLSLAACVAALSTALPALAQTHNPKLASDLSKLLGSSSNQGQTWAKNQNG